MKNIKILYVNSDKSGCGYYRCFIPAYYLLSNGVTVNFSDFLSEKLVKEYDYIVLQRNYSEKCLQLIKKYKNKTTFLYELDDDLLNLYEFHHRFQFYKDKKDLIIKIIKNCNALIVSTEELLNKYIKYNPNVYLMPNFIIPIEKNNSKTEKKGEIRILYAGTKSHKEDYLEVSKIIKNISKKEKIKMVFLGFKPDIFDNSFMEYHESVDIWDLSEKIVSLNIDIGIAPLCDLEFKKNKSNIKYIEYSYLGIPGLYKDDSPYKEVDGKNGLKYKTINEFEKKILILIKDIKIREKIKQNAKKYIEKYYINNIKEYLFKIYNIKLSDITYNKKKFEFLKEKLSKNFLEKKININFNRCYIYGYSETGKIIEKYLENLGVEILGIYDNNKINIRKSKYIDIYNDNPEKDVCVVICSKGYSNEIKNILIAEGFKKIFSIY